MGEVEECVEVSSTSETDSEENGAKLKFVERIRKSTRRDESLMAVVNAIENENAQRVRNFTVAECSWNDGILRYRERIVVPQCNDDNLLTTELIKSYHEPPAAGHQGAAATYAVLARDFFLHGMLQQVKKFVRKCHTCSRSKPSREAAQGLLRPLPIARECWRHIAMDFVVDRSEERRVGKECQP